MAIESHNSVNVASPCRVAESTSPGPAPPGPAGVGAARPVMSLSSTDRVEEFLTDLARTAVAHVGAASACGLTVRGIPPARLLAATSNDLARRMDEIQYQLDDGPCLSCLRGNAVVEISDLATDDRWPEFSRRGRTEGAGASMSMPLTAGEHAVGALNLYAATPGAFTATDRERARRLAARAACAVAVAASLAEQEELARNLRIALTARSTIDQAIGILMGRHRIPAEAAFDLLRRGSQHTNTKLRDLATQVITETTAAP